MPRIDVSAAPVTTGSDYPEPYAAAVTGRRSIRLGQAGGLSQFGVNLVILQPGGRSSLRHWHRNEDEFVMVTQGTLVLVEDQGETEMRPGDCAAFPAGEPNGHCLVNRSTAEARFLVVGTKAAHEVATYPDVDMIYEFKNGTGTYTCRDGTPCASPDEEDAR